MNENNEKLGSTLTMPPTSIIEQRNDGNVQTLKTNSDIINDYNNKQLDNYREKLEDAGDDSRHIIIYYVPENNVRTDCHLLSSKEPRTLREQRIMKILKDPNSVRDVAYLTLSQTMEYYSTGGEDKEAKIIEKDNIK